MFECDLICRQLMYTQGMDIMNDSKTFDTLLRHLAMLRLVQRWPRKTPTTEIRTRLIASGYPDVTLRTIQRDLVKLSGIFPLISDENKPRGWSWEKDAKPIDIPTMDSHTALTLRILDNFAQGLIPRTTLQYLKPHIDLADKVLNNQADTSYRSWTEKICVVPKGQPLLPPDIIPEVLDAAYTAIFKGKQLYGQYRKRGEKLHDSRELNPLGIVFKESVIYLVASELDQQDIKQFALHRFQTAEVIDEPCRVPGGFRLVDYVGQGEFQYPEDGTIRFKALFDAGAAIHLHETKLSKDQHLTDTNDGRVLVEATLQMTSQFRWWILGFGEQIVVLEPDGLRQEIIAIAQNMVNAYNKTS